MQLLIRSAPASGNWPKTDPGNHRRQAGTSNFRFGDASDLAHLVTTPTRSSVLAAFEAEGVDVTLI